MGICPEIYWNNRKSKHQPNSLRMEMVNYKELTTEHIFIGIYEIVINWLLIRACIQFIRLTVCPFNLNAFINKPFLVHSFYHRVPYIDHYARRWTVISIVIRQFYINGIYVTVKEFIFDCNVPPKIFKWFLIAIVTNTENRVKDSSMLPLNLLCLRCWR